MWKEEWNRERPRAPSAAATHTCCCQNVCAAPHSRHPWHLCRAAQTLAQDLAKPQACTFWGQFTNLVGKEQIAHSVVVWVLHDGSDHLQHWGDACKTGPTYTEWVPAGAHQTPKQGDVWDTQAWPQASLLPYASSHPHILTHHGSAWVPTLTCPSCNHAYRLHRPDNRVGLLVCTDGKLPWEEEEGAAEPYGVQGRKTTTQP